jgi:hypothetical protein
MSYTKSRSQFFASFAWSLAFATGCAVVFPSHAQTEDHKAAMAEVEKAHPGWRKTVTSPEFKHWLAKQPPSLIHLANNSWEPSQVSMVLDLYKRDTVKPIPAPQANPDQVLGALGALLGAAAAIQEGRNIANTNRILLSDQPQPLQKPARAPDYTCDRSVLGNQYSCTAR